MASDLTWTKHVEELVHKANKVLGLLKGTVRNKNMKNFTVLYKTLVRRSWNTLARCGNQI